MTRHHCWAIVAGLACAIQSPGVYAAPPPPADQQPPKSPWTTTAIVEAPNVLETAITRDGTKALYIVRVNNIEADKRESHLYEVSLTTGNQREILRASWISDIAAVPETDDWSFRADLGAGVQLYRLAKTGHLSPIVLQPKTVIVGYDPTIAISYSPTEDNQAFGVLGYGWSANGKYLWYSTAHTIAPVSKPMVVLDNPLIPLDVYVPNVSELHVINQQGNDTTVASSQGDTSPFPTIIYNSNAASWDVSANPGGSPSLIYRAETAVPNHARVFEQKRYDPTTRASSSITPEDTNQLSAGRRTGTRGGTLKIMRTTGEPHLVEEMAAGEQLDLGKAALSFSWPYAKGEWHFQTERSAVQAVRITDFNLRNSIVKMTPDNRIHYLEPTLSLSHCSFSEAAAKGVCVREGITQPPELVSVDVKSWSTRFVASVDRRYETIKPLRAEPRIWKAGALEATGFLLYPRDYVPGRRYPAIILTHGYDADNTFARKGFQWSYPAQVWAERGYLVIGVNDIVDFPGTEKAKAYDQWVGVSNDLPPEKLFQLIWQDNVKIYVETVRSLASAGVIDPDRVGIAGFSRGSQMVDVAVTQTNLFKAASSGDGGNFAPSTYWWQGINETLKMLFGGSPYDPRYQAKWAEIAPAFRAENARTPVLFQTAKSLVGEIDFYHALRDHNVPAEIAFWPNESHLFHSPLNQLTAMEQNLDWFDFWLKGTEDTDPLKAEQYARWRTLRERQTASN